MLLRSAWLNLLKLLKDESGKTNFWSSLFGGGEEEVYDPYSDLRKDYTSYLGKKLGTSTPYQYNPAFELPKPEIEKQTESTILGNLRNLPQKRTDIFDINQKYGTARKAQMSLQQEDDVRKQKDMYNRLGLVSSTPGLQAETDLRYKQGLDKAALDAEIAQQGIGQEMDAEKLYNDIANQWTTQGQVLGSSQRGYSQYAINKSMEDLARKISEEQAYAGLTGSILGEQPERSYTPSFGEQILGYGSEILPYLLMLGL